MPNKIFSCRKISLFVLEKEIPKQPLESLHNYFFNRRFDKNKPSPPIVIKSTARTSKSSADKSMNTSFTIAKAKIAKPVNLRIRKLRIMLSHSEILAVIKSIIVVKAIRIVPSSNWLYVN